MTDMKNDFAAMMRDFIETKWFPALRQGPEAVAALYANEKQDGEQAVLLPTVEGRVCDTPDAIKSYFTHFCSMDPIGTITEIRTQVYNDKPGNRIGNVMGHYDFEVLNAEGKREKVMARMTFTMKEFERGLRFVHHHSSKQPPKPEDKHRPEPQIRPGIAPSL